ncbi:alpha/beta fold hydrolase [Pseudomonas chlororaphis]|uniref:alpha/beta fold hydrolase n=1 Tax=Pseudomonas chlororaphis TaxID=587753 RepID=UPI003450787E
MITTPVIVFGCSQDRAVHPAIARNMAALYPQSTHVELEGSDHLMIIGRYAAVAMDHVDTWLSKNGLLP